MLLGRSMLLKNSPSTFKVVVLFDLIKVIERAINNKQRWEIIWIQ